MALTKEKKIAIVQEVTDLISQSKMSVVVNYQGTSVKQLQNIRQRCKADGTSIKIIKNRLFIQSLKSLKTFENSDTSNLNKMLLYVFNDSDEILPAKVIAEAAKQIETLKFVGAYLPNGQFIDANEVSTIAVLPSKEQLRGILVGTISAPLTKFVNVLNGSLLGVINVLNARASKLEIK